MTKTEIPNFRKFWEKNAYYDNNEQRSHSHSQIEISIFTGKRCGQKYGLEQKVSQSLEEEKEITTLIPTIELSKAEVIEIF